MANQYRNNLVGVGACDVHPLGNFGIESHSAKTLEPRKKSNCIFFRGFYLCESIMLRKSKKERRSYPTEELATELDQRLSEQIKPNFLLQYYRDKYNKKHLQFYNTLQQGIKN